MPRLVVANRIAKLSFPVLGDALTLGSWIEISPCRQGHTELYFRHLCGLQNL